MRGGVAVLVKDYLWPYVYDVKRIKDQVWFRLQTFDFLFGAVYIAPRDSPFFTTESFACINELIGYPSDKVIVLGDLNARVNNLHLLNNPDQCISYANNVDGISNANGKDLMNLCISNSLKVVNHLQYKAKVFDGNFTFKRQNRWISQLDWAVVSEPACENLISFKILQDIDLHTDHAPITLKLGNFKLSASDLYQRSAQLGTSVIPRWNPLRKPITMMSIDSEKFVENMPTPDDLWEVSGDQELLCGKIADLIYDTAAKCRKKIDIQNDNTGCFNATTRWNKILNLKDSRKLWNSINWNGVFETIPDVLNQPTDDAFCKYYETLLSAPEVPLNFEPAAPRYIPVLDDPIMPGEVDDCIKSLKSNKAAGIDGVAPGLLKLLNDSWILLITFLFNCVFFGHYPLQWCAAKVFNIFKKGDRMLPSNYRGISILVALAKLYDMTLSQRLLFGIAYQSNKQEVRKEEDALTNYVP